RVAAMVVKRLFDIVVAGLALLVASPFLAVIALAIRRRDGSPILFRQVRVGLHGRQFEVLKFRTMVPDAEARYAEVVKHSDPRAFKLTNDPRITRTGRFLRRTSLDELPQLWNVLSGEMSLVGPRPIVGAEKGKYGAEFRLYCTVRPGMTGLWQISGRNDTTYSSRVALDQYYVHNWSPW